MSKWVLDESGEQLDYPTLGFRAAPGDILDATAAPDGRWSLNGDQGAAETVARYTIGADPSYVEPGDGHVLTWSDSDNTYVPTAPVDLLHDEDFAADLSASIAGMTIQRWAALTAYTAGDVRTAPDGSVISRISNGTSRATFDSTEQALWTPIISKTGTLAQVAMAATIAAATDSRLARLRSLFDPGAYGQWYLQRVTASKYKAFRDAGEGRFFATDISIVTAPQSGTDTCHQLQDVNYGPLMTSVDSEAGTGVTRSGTGWAAATSDSNAYGGSYRTSNSSLATDTYVSPAAVTSIGVRTVMSSNGGAALVTVDGSRTAANLLPTAQTLVTAGSLPSTALVANGGPFNPTDRVLLLYKAGSTDTDVAIPVADGLSPASHTTVASATSVIPTGSGGTRLYSSAWCYSTGAETPLSTGAIVMPKYVIQTGRSAWEPVWDYEPVSGSTSTTGSITSGSNVLTLSGRTVLTTDVGTDVSVYGAGAAGGKLSATITAVNTGSNTWTLSVNAATTVAGGAVTTSQFCGSIHGYEAETSLSIIVDGADPGLTDGTAVAIKGYASIVKRSILHHPDVGAGATTVAELTTGYRLDREGLGLTRTPTWRTPGTIRTAYAAMLPLNGYVMDRGGFPDSAATQTLTAADDSQHGKTIVPAAYLWDADGTTAAMVELLDTAQAMNNWANSSNQFAWIQDRSVSSGLKYNKVYFSRVSPNSAPVTVAAGDVWTSSARYRFARFPQGAANVLPML